MNRKKGVPVLLADLYKARDKSIHMKAWCNSCAKYHFHGGVEEGSLTSHCEEETIWHGQQYYLKIDRDNPENIKLLQEHKKVGGRT